MTSGSSQSSEDFTNAPPSAADITCTKDDQMFIRNARARNVADVDGRRIIEGGNRVALLWGALWRLLSSLRQKVFLQLLQGGDDGEDVWLWNEGDDTFMEGVDLMNSSPPWMSAAAALEIRLTQTPMQTLRRRQVRYAVLEMRIAMIVWLALTSRAYKIADQERGGRDREQCDMQGWIGEWYYSLPSQQDNVIYFGYGGLPTPGSEPPPSWTPSPTLVALRCIWDGTEDSADRIDARRDFSEWLSDQFGIYGLKEVNKYFSSLPRDTDGAGYLSWVNTYPHRLRYTVTKYTLEEWQAMDNSITASECGGSLNIRSWCAAMFWKMMRDDLPYSTRIEQFIYDWHDCVRWELDFLPSPTPAQKFHDAIGDSGHTCWEEPQMDDYATAMAFLNEEAKVVGIDVWKDSRCQVCRFHWHLRSLSDTLLGEKRGAFDDPQGWIDDRKIACIDLSEVKGLIYMYSVTVDTNSVEQPDLTLDIHHSTALATMSRYLAWKPMIIKLFAEFPEGTFDLDQIHRIIHLDTITICGHLLNVIKNPDDYKQFTSESQPLSKAQESLNLLLQLLDLDDIPPKVRSCFSKTMASLCRKTGLYPESLTLNGLQKIGGRVEGSGFGDVSIGILRGTKVSIKTPRVPQWELKRLLKDFSR
ncbi:hypothetical protein C8J56DRAFT_1050500 [Mycena floridula]|nr:hypothetical protein C8J56DRAFT_1050500 [Mycena floridula]